MAEEIERWRCCREKLGRCQSPRWANLQIGLQVVAIRWWVSPESPGPMATRKPRSSGWNVSDENTSQLYSHRHLLPTFLKRPAEAPREAPGPRGRPRRRVPEIRAGPCASDQLIFSRISLMSPGIVRGLYVARSHILLLGCWKKTDHSTRVFDRSKVNVFPQSNIDMIKGYR